MQTVNDGSKDGQILPGLLQFLTSLKIVRKGMSCILVKLALYGYRRQECKDNNDIEKVK